MHTYWILAIFPQKGKKRVELPPLPKLNISGVWDGIMSVYLRPRLGQALVLNHNDNPNRNTPGQRTTIYIVVCSIFSDVIDSQDFGQKES